MASHRRGLWKQVWLDRITYQLEKGDLQWNLKDLKDNNAMAFFATVLCNTCSWSVCMCSVDNPVLDVISSVYRVYIEYHCVLFKSTFQLKGHSEMCNTHMQPMECTGFISDFCCVFCCTMYKLVILYWTHKCEPDSCYWALILGVVLFRF